MNKTQTNKELERFMESLEIRMKVHSSMVEFYEKVQRESPDSWREAYDKDIRRCNEKLQLVNSILDDARKHLKTETRTQDGI